MSMTHDEMIAVIAAHRDGKVIQYIEKGTSDTWADCINNSPVWDFYHYNYRIEPEPRVVWFNEYPGHFGGIYSSREAALQSARDACIRQVKFIEAIEE